MNREARFSRVDGTRIPTHTQGKCVRIHTNEYFGMIPLNGADCETSQDSCINSCVHKTQFHIKHADANIIITIIRSIIIITIIIAIFMWNLRLKFA